MLTFIVPAAFLLLVLLPLFALLFWWRARARRIAAARLGDTALLAALVETPQPHRGQVLLWLGALVALIFALARPQWGIAPEVIEVQGVSVMLVLDVSRSMDAQDVLPSRLERAKLDMRDLLVQLEGNNLGLILFAGEAVLQFPLTSDTASALNFVAAASSRALTRQGTALSAALRLALAAFDERRAESQIIAVISDGEDHAGDIEQVASEASARGVVIYTIGYGSLQGAPVPELDDDGQITGLRTLPDGTAVLTRLEEEPLQSLAASTGGLYFRAGGGAPVIANLAAVINRASSTLEARIEQRPIERFGLFVALSLLALALETLLPVLRSRRRRVA